MAGDGNYFCVRAYVHNNNIIKQILRSDFFKPMLLTNIETWQVHYLV